jgi:hypothetical protein
MVDAWVDKVVIGRIVQDYKDRQRFEHGLTKSGEVPAHVWLDKV